MLYHDKHGHAFTEKYLVVPITVAGVTHKNGRRHRQTILRRIYWKDDPYQKVDGVDIVATTFNDEPAVEVWVYNKKIREMIGYVPKQEASFVHSISEYFESSIDFDVYGGGKASDGTELSYGASVTLRFHTPPGTENVDPVPPPEPEHKEEPKPSLHDRTYELYHKMYPDEKGNLYTPVTGTEHTAIIIKKARSGKTHRIVVYNPESDTIGCFDKDMHFISGVRPRPKAGSKKKSGSTGHPFFWAFVIISFILGVASAIFK